MKKILVISGGTGSSIVLKSLKNLKIDLAALVPMGDSGGSTGRLRDEFGVLSGGELRQRLVALASEDETTKYLTDLLDHRFKGGKELKGHNIGNLLICAFTEMYGSQAKALTVLSKLLKVKGEIVPSTWERFDLVAEYADGSKTVGEHFIDEPETDKKVKRLYTEPPVNANPRALEVIKNADYIIFTMGDLYTSVLHSVIVKGVADAIAKSKAKKIYIANLMTSVGETTGMNLGDHIAEIEKYTGAKIDIALVNSKEIPKAMIDEHKKSNQGLVKNTMTADQKKRIKVVTADLLSEEIYGKSSSDILQRSILRHSADKIASEVAKLI